MKKIILAVCGAMLAPALMSAPTALTTTAATPAITKSANNAQLFFNEIKKHCGKAYKGRLIAGGDKEFLGKNLVMHIRGCKENEISIPFFVGNDKSRTWVLKLKGKRMQLKHDHRMHDGKSDKVTMYGGTSTNNGTPNMQVFPADQKTVDLADYTAPNVWWMTIDGKSFTYNLRRLGTSRLFTVKFDLTKPLKTAPDAPWGWKGK